MTRIIAPEGMSEEQQVEWIRDRLRCLGINPDTVYPVAIEGMIDDPCPTLTMTFRYENFSTPSKDDV